MKPQRAVPGYNSKLKDSSPNGEKYKKLGKKIISLIFLQEGEECFSCL